MRFESAHLHSKQAEAKQNRFTQASKPLFEVELWGLLLYIHPRKM